MTELYSISEIFEKRIFRVPDFQRGYSWGQKQLQDFWEDINKIDNKRTHNYISPTISSGFTHSSN